LLLFYSYRGLPDLYPISSHGGFPFVTKLREVYADDDARKDAGKEKRVFNARNLSFLQNIQNSAYTSLRYKLSTDDLQSTTHPFSVKDVDMFEILDEVHGEEEDIDELPYEAFLDHCDSEDGNDTDFLSMKLQNYSFRPMRNGGMHGCGFNTKIPPIQTPVIGSFMTVPVQDVLHYHPGGLLLTNRTSLTS
jgi:hypothetical protein